MRALLSRYILELSTDGHSPATVEEYAAEIGRWQRSGLSAIDYLASLRVCPGTRTLRGLILNRYLAWQVREGFLDVNPLVGLHFRRPPATPVRPFSEAESDVLLAACRSELERAVVLCLLRLGLRASELASVREGDVQDGCLFVKGKGGKMRRLAVSGLVGPLRAISDGRLSYLAVYRIVRAVGARAGVSDCHSHRFRHTFGCRALEAGMDALSLQVLMGHADLAMTRRYVMYGEQERAVEAHRRFLES